VQSSYGPLTAQTSGQEICESRGASRCLGISPISSSYLPGYGFLVVGPSRPLGRGLLVMRLGCPLG
ncbi:hypothetical protein PanWU01x14_327490, partial [Parasponia andersonii]